MGAKFGRIESHNPDTFDIRNSLMATQQTIDHANRRNMILCRLLTFNLCALAATWASAASIIDFETTPAGFTPVDDAPLSSLTPYVFPGLQISFGLDTNGDGIVDTDTVFEHAGLDPGEPPNGGFSGSAGPDTADPGFTAQLGNWFLRSPVGGSDFGLLVITYSSTSPVTAASGEIWDIDGTATFPGGPGDTEEYTVRAYDSSNNLLATQVSPLGTLTSAIAPLDGEPWVFSFSGLSPGIAQITIDFTGTKTQGIGLAFNNFYPTDAAVPEPATGLLFAGGASALLVWNRRRLRLRGANAGGAI
jgi:PEP-CTERM motif